MSLLFNIIPLVNMVFVSLNLNPDDYRNKVDPVKSRLEPCGSSRPDAHTRTHTYIYIYKLHTNSAKYIGNCRICCFTMTGNRRKSASDCQAG